MSENQASGLPLFEQRARRLGRKHNDASPGDHTHNGVNSKKLKVSDGVLSDLFVVSGSWNVAGGAGDITIPHTLGVVPSHVLFLPWAGVRGFYNYTQTLSTTTDVLIRCFDPSNAVRANGTNIPGTLLALA